MDVNTHEHQQMHAHRVIIWGGESACLVHAAEDEARCSRLAPRNLPSPPSFATGPLNSSQSGITVSTSLEQSFATC